MNEIRQAESPVNGNEVRAQMGRILQSKTLGASDQLKRLLTLTVERTLSGQPELLKEYNLGLEVFQRPPDYDPKVDPIVRVQARRLRAKLDEYYAGEGARDPVVIQLPKGAYVPAFEVRSETKTEDGTAPFTGLKAVKSRSWLLVAGATMVVASVTIAWLARIDPGPDSHRSVAVLPLKIFPQNNSDGYVAEQVTEVLTTELARSKQLRVLSRTTASKYRDTTLSLPRIAADLGVRWVVEGGVGIEGGRAYVKLRAVDSKTDRKIWADVFDFEIRSLVSVSSQAARAIGSAIEAHMRSAGD
ncbi:MAG TPA: hypothetical protein VEQ63_06550 [Bryobacteraceae bacterium]|nr:hypothetical protein [Bryobacteraceae bacterium]